MKWIVLLSAVLFAAACSNDSAEINGIVSKGLVKVNIEAAQSSVKSGGFKRGNAPVYIDGVIIKADNKEYTEAKYDVTQEFLFKSDRSDDGVDIVMTDVYVGTTNISAVGICDVDNKVNTYIQELTSVNIDALDAAAKKYDENLRTSNPVYAHYVSEPTADIVVANDATNAITVNMNSENHRVAFVMENPSTSLYDIKWRVSVKDGAVLNTWSDYMDAGTQQAYIINDAYAVNARTYMVEVQYFTKDSHEPMLDESGDEKVFTKEVTANALDNVTKLYRFTKEGLLQGDVNATITWEQKDPIADGEEIE